MIQVNLQTRVRAHKAEAKALMKILKDPSPRKAKRQDQKKMNQVILIRKALYIS